MKLSILIRSLYKREAMLNSLLKNLYNQIIEGNYYCDVEVLVERDNKEMTSGAKANLLLSKAKGHYIVFIDDDDEVSSEYIKLILKATESNPDCVGTRGTYSIDGRGSIEWELSKDFIDSDDYSSGRLTYKRRTNHISPVKRELALMAMFPDKSNAEDKWYSERLIKHLNTEIKINELIYHYKYSSQNKEYV